MQLLMTYLPKIEINDLLKCTINPTQLSTDLPQFYRQVLFAWYDCKLNPNEPLEIRREYLWFNKHICINNEPIFITNLYKKSIKSINDLLDHTGKFLDYINFNAKYQTNVNFLQHMAIIDAIPKNWKKQLKTCTFPNTAVNSAENPHMKINTQFKDVTQIKTKEIYIELLKKTETKPTCIEAWNTRLSIFYTDKDWESIFTLPKLTVCDTKILELQYKILHRCHATDSIISKWDLSKSEVCQKCSSKANILHKFVTCTEVMQFWEDIYEFMSTHGIETPDCLQKEDILLGCFKHAKYDLYNHVIMHAKYFIHKKHINEEKLISKSFINYYRQVILTEKERYIEKLELQNFFMRFGKYSILDDLNI